MLNNDMLLGGSLAPGWRKIIVTADSYLNSNAGRYYTSGYGPNRLTIWNKYWQFPNSSISNNLLEDGRSILALYSATTIETDYSGEQSKNYYSSYTRLVLSRDLGDKDTIYVKKGKDGKLFTFWGGNSGMNVSHGSSSKKPSTAPSDFLFLPEDRNKVLDIYIGLTPPPH